MGEFLGKVGKVGQPSKEFIESEKWKSECRTAWRKYRQVYDPKKKVSDLVWHEPFNLPPKPSDPETIANYGKPKKERKFPYYSDEYVQRMSSKDDKGNYRYPEWVKEEIRRRFEGFFFFNGDKLEWVTGHHYMTMQYWKIPIPDKKTKRMKRGKPYFIDAQRDYWYAMNAMRIDEDSMGMMVIGYRRFSKTVTALAEGYWDATENEESVFPIQSKTEKDAEKVFTKLIDSWKLLPAFLKPVDDGSTSQSKKLVFEYPKRKGVEVDERLNRDALRSRIYYVTSNEVEVDGDYLSYFFRDEAAKCLVDGSLILDRHGNDVRVNDVKVGDEIMNPDGRYSTVISNHTQKIDCYRVLLKNGDYIDCSKNHLLSLKWSKREYKLNYNGDRYSFGETVNIPVSDFINLSYTKRKHLTSYYPEMVECNDREVPLDPYFMGLWLGDGSRSDSRVFNIDDEIINFCRDNYPVSINIKKKDRDKPISVIRYYGGRKLLREAGVFQNKHIPKDYLFNSEQKRLELLAGLIDSDGWYSHRGGKSSFSITQKRKNLSEDIMKLCRSLGFGCNIKKVVAKMNREDGTVYECDVYQNHIHGDLHRIPTKVKRKQAVKIENHHINRRNPLRKGIKEVIPLGKKTVYGFTLDRDSLFMTSSFLVTHNSAKNIDIQEGWYVTKPTLMIGNMVVGKAIFTSTVEDSEKYGSASCRRLWEDSDPRLRMPNGQTKSGLYQFFVPAYYGFMGETDKDTFVDEWGYSNVEAARAYHEGYMKHLSDDQLLSYKRKFPLSINDAWINKQNDNTFNQKKLLDHQLFLRGLEEEGRPQYVQGNFEWKYGQRDTEVIWRPSKEGRWFKAFDPNEEDRCQWEMAGIHRKPKRQTFYLGVDAYSNDAAVRHGSNGSGITVAKGYPYAPFSEGVVCYYNYRPPTANDFAEDMILQAMYYSSPLLVERNTGGFRQYFDERGYKSFLMKNPLETDPRKMAKEDAGFPNNSPDNRERLINMAAAYIMDNIGVNEETGEYGFCPFEGLIEQLMAFDPLHWGRYDAVVAFGLAVIAARARRKTPTFQQKDVKKWFRNNPF